MGNQYLANGKRILFFVDGFVGGAGNVVQLLAREFSDAGCAVEICCLGGTTEGRHDLSGISVFGIEKKRNKVINYISYSIAANKEINNFKPDCVISFLFGVSAFVGLAVKMKRNYLFITSERSDPTALKPHGLVHKLVISSYSKANGIVVLFDAFKGLENGRFRNKCYTIPNPVPEISCEPRQENSSSLTFVTIANESKPKGLDLLLDAFRRAQKEKHDIQLKIYGNIYTDNLPTYIRTHGLEYNVRLMGYTQNIEAALEDADVYIMPSRIEGFPNSLCEAMSAGKACIAFECHGGISELIEDGINGIVVPSENVSMLAERIVWLSKHPEMVYTLGNNAKRITEKYSLNSVINRWDSLLFDLSKQ